MPLSNIFSEEFVSDINTASNLTSAGVGINALETIKKSLRVNIETLKELGINHKWERENSLMHTRLLSEILSTLKSIDQQLKKNEEGR